MADERYWIESVADDVEAYVARRPHAPRRLVCASGVSPSGAIHLGNVREVMTVHLVVEELRRRGHDAEHVHSWDDYDRFRKVPAGLPESYSEHLGKPLCAVPDVDGTYASYAERHMQEFEAAAAELGIVGGVNIRYVRQSVAYQRGDYLEGIRTALRNRAAIFEILARYQTAARHDEGGVDERRASYYPFKPYCSSCYRDTTRVTSYDDQTTRIAYECACGHTETYLLSEGVRGKLVWKVDWPMRWAYEDVVFEPGGEDHAAPGSSYTVGREVVRLFGAEAPHFIPYTFVGMTGRSKISSSAGGSPTPRQALDILEPTLVRWLYIRRVPARRFDIDFGSEVVRLYDEWDAFGAAVRAGGAGDADVRTIERCCTTSALTVAAAASPVSFRTLAAAADVTHGNREQLLRIAREQLAQPDLTAAALEPRLSCAIRWALSYVPEDERTHIRPAYAPDVYQALPAEHQRGICILRERLASAWSIDGLTALLYGIPKELLGLPLDAPPTPELKQLQRSFFISLYQLICAADTGPRLPTLFLSLGREHVAVLLGGSDAKNTLV